MQKNQFDCMQATLSNLLEIEYSTIPNFYQIILDGGTADEFEGAIDKFLCSLGLFRITIPISKNDSGGYSLPYFCSLNRYKCIGVVEKSGNNFSHAVILDIERISTGLSIEIIHDPKINTDYTIDDLIQIELILKI